MTDAESLALSVADSAATAILQQTAGKTGAAGRMDAVGVPAHSAVTTLLIGLAIGLFVAILFVFTPLQSPLTRDGHSVAPAVYCCNCAADVLPSTAGLCAPVAGCPCSPAGSDPLPSLAVLLHLGSLQLVGEFVAYLRHLEGASLRFDLLVSVAAGRVNVTDPLLLPLRSAFPGARIVSVANRGMDIGGFLQLVPAVLAGPYQVVLKLHTKRLDGWRTEMLRPLIGSAEQAKFNVDLFARFPSVGMVAPARFHFPEFVRSTHPNNIVTMAALSAELGFPPVINGTGIEFVAGTTFFLRRSVLDCALGGRDLRRLVGGLAFGGASGSEGTAAHGWERFLGLMVQACGFDIQGTGTLVRDANGTLRLDPQNNWSLIGYVPVPVRNDLVAHPFGAPAAAATAPDSNRH